MLLILLVMVCSCIAVDAKDYVEVLGPFKANFSVSDSLVTRIDSPFEHSTSDHVTVEGIPYTVYRCALTSANKRSSFEFTIAEYERPIGYMNFSRMEQVQQNRLKDRNYVSFEIYRRMIDSKNGLFTIGRAGWGEHDAYQFAYSLDNKTAVAGISYLGDVVEPFLNSLHIERVS